MALFSSATTFLSRGLSRGDKAGTRRVSALLRLTTIGVALSLSVMLLSVTIILGSIDRSMSSPLVRQGISASMAMGATGRPPRLQSMLSPELLSFLRERRGSLPSHLSSSRQGFSRQRETSRAFFFMGLTLPSVVATSLSK